MLLYKQLQQATLSLFVLCVQQTHMLVLDGWSMKVIQPLIQLG